MWPPLLACRSQQCLFAKYFREKVHTARTPPQNTLLSHYSENGKSLKKQQTEGGRAELDYKVFGNVIAKQQQTNTWIFTALANIQFLFIFILSYYLEEKFSNRYHQISMSSAHTSMFGYTISSNIKGSVRHPTSIYLFFHPILSPFYISSV